MKLFLTSLMVLCIIGIGWSYGIQPDYAVAKIEWNEFAFSGFDGTKAKVSVNDPDMNRYPNAIDYLWITIHSDSDPDLKGTKIPLFETGLDSGIFEGEVTFTSSPPSGKGFLHVVTGDTISAKYVDRSIPVNFTATNLPGITLMENGFEVTASAIITGKRGPPIERVPASNFTLLNLQSESIKDNMILVGQQVRLVSDLQNQYNHTQPFAYLVQIRDDNDKVESLSWVAGNLASLQKLNTGVTWLPLRQGLYSATIFVWESIENPTALSPPLEMEIKVKDGSY